MSHLMIKLVHFYQQWSSTHRPFRVCRYEPTCSQYMVQAIERFGMKGVLLGIARLLRCQPFSGSGYDPVPEHFTFKSYTKRQR